MGLAALLQFGDSVLPVGSFAFSNSLETALHTSLVHDGKTLERFVATALNQAATSDGIALLEAHRATLRGDLAGVSAADHQTYNRKMNEEMRLMTTRMGNKLVELARPILNDSFLTAWSELIRSKSVPGTYPVSQAVIFAVQGVSESTAFGVHQYGLASMMLSAALRLMKINHLETQAILHRLNRDMPSSYERVASLHLSDMATFSPLIDIFSAVHVKSNVRLFMS